jgi:hypothetical protein
MAARVLLQRVRLLLNHHSHLITPLTAGLQRSLAPLATFALGGLAFAPATVLAEGPPVDKVRIVEHHRIIRKRSEELRGG